MSKEHQAVSPEQKNRRHLILCQADEIQGEHDRLIQFLMRAATPARATEDTVASFFNAGLSLVILQLRSGQVFERSEKSRNYLEK